MDSKHDEMLFELLKECRTLPVFLDEVFGFLYRRTDFYHIAKEENSPVGLPDGLAENLVKQAFFKWKQKKSDIVLSDTEVPAVSEETVITEVEDEAQQGNVTASADEMGSLVKQCQEFSTSESYNGAVYENYSWSQNIHDIDVIVKVPNNITAKDLKVNILPDRISVQTKDMVLLEGDLCHKCKHHDALWSLVKNKLEIHLDKTQEIWWDCLITSEPRLDLKKIDCTRPFEDLPEDAQAKIEELQWNQERKRLGLLTSEEMKQHEMLKKAWNAKGSPFSGPFDPSAVSFS